MKQTSPHIEDKLLDFVYGELPTGEAQAVEAHLQGCPACSGALESIQGVRRVMSRLPVETAPDAGLESLLGYAQQAARRASAGPAPKPTWWRRAVAPLAGLAALVVMLVVVQQAKRTYKFDAEKMEAPAAVAVAPNVEPPPMNQAPEVTPAESRPVDMVDLPAHQHAAPKAIAAHHAGPAKDGPMGFDEDRQVGALDGESGNSSAAPGRLAQGVRARDKAGVAKGDLGFSGGAGAEQLEPRGAAVGSSTGGVNGNGLAQAPAMRMDSKKKAREVSEDQAKEEGRADRWAAGAVAEAEKAPASRPAPAPSTQDFRSVVTAAKPSAAPPPPAAPSPSPVVTYGSPLTTASAPVERKALADNFQNKGSDAKADDALAKTESSSVEAFSRRARAEHDVQEFRREIQDLKSALAAAGTGPQRQGLLDRLCEVETRMGLDEACVQLQKEFPQSWARKAAERQKALLEAAPPAKAAKQIDTPAAASQ